MEMNEKKPLLKATGFWKHVDKNGNVFLSGSMGSISMTIFTNTYKTPGSKEPDFNMYYGERKREESAKKPEDCSI